MSINDDKTSTDPVLAEYAELSAHIRIGIKTMWEGVRTYFIFIGILIAALGFFLSAVTPMDLVIGVDTKTLGILLICFLGMGASIGAGVLVDRFIIYLETCIKLGQELERKFNGQLYEKFWEIWRRAESKLNAPKIIKWIFWLFALIWFIVFLVNLLPHKPVV